MTVLTAAHILIPTALSLHPNLTALSLHPNLHCTLPACCHVYNGAGANDFSSLNAATYITVQVQLASAV